MMVTAESYKWLTKRDMNILRTLYYHRFMSTSQIQRIFFDGTYSDVVTRRRLKKLRDNELIKSYYRADNADMIHTINEDGVFIVAAMEGKVFNDMYYNTRKDLLAFGLAEHSLLLTDVYIKLLEHSETLEGQIELFQVEKLNEEEFEYQGNKYKFRPDIFLIYRPDKNKDIVRLFFIEVDNGTENPKLFFKDKKIPAYETFYNSNIFQERYNGLFPEIVVLCHDEKRIKKLKKVTNTFLTWTYLLFDDVVDILN